MTLLQHPSTPRAGRITSSATEGVMPQIARSSFAIAFAAVAIAAASWRAPAGAQSAVQPANDAPNPYTTIEGWAKMPAGRTWGSTSAVDIDRDGVSVWVAERCSANTCWNAAEGKMSPLDVVLKFDANGKHGAQLRCRHVRVPARHSCRSRRQHLGHRRTGQFSSPRPWRCRGCAAAGAAGQDRRTSGDQVQP